jgi:hypothetical protein
MTVTATRQEDCYSSSLTNDDLTTHAFDVENQPAHRALSLRYDNNTRRVILLMGFVLIEISIVTYESLDRMADQTSARHKKAPAQGRGFPSNTRCLTHVAPYGMPQ